MEIYSSEELSDFERMLHCSSFINWNEVALKLKNKCVTYRLQITVQYVSLDLVERKKSSAGMKCMRNHHSRVIT